MKDTEILQTLINTSSDFMMFEDIGKNKEPQKLYNALFEIMLEISSEEQKEIIGVMDDMIGIMLGNYHDDGFVEGLMFSSNVRDILNSPSAAYEEILNNTSVPDCLTKRAYELIKNYNYADEKQ